MGLFMSKQAKEERKAKRLAIGNEIKNTLQEITDFTTVMTNFIEKAFNFTSQAGALRDITNKRRILEIAKEIVVDGEDLIKEQDSLKEEYKQLINKINTVLNKYNDNDFIYGSLAVNINCERNKFIELRNNITEAIEPFMKLELKDMVYNLQDYIEENDVN